MMAHPNWLDGCLSNVGQHCLELLCDTAGRHADGAAAQAVMSVTSAAASTYSDGQSVSRWSGLLPLVASGLQLAPACIAANHRDVAASGLSCLTTLLGEPLPPHAAACHMPLSAEACTVTNLLSVLQLP